jgi:hypothetical protein
MLEPSWPDAAPALFGPADGYRQNNRKSFSIALHKKKPKQRT